MGACVEPALLPATFAVAVTLASGLAVKVENKIKGSGQE
jgi:hypothetical protein